GIDIGVTATPPAGGAGIYRNNIVRASGCATHIDVRESVASADPRIFENNDLDPTAPLGAPVLYSDEGATSLTTIAAVNALTDMTVSGNISVDAMYVGYPLDLHLTAGSMCIGAGTPTGEPMTGMDGDPRGVANGAARRPWTRAPAANPPGNPSGPARPETNPAAAAFVTSARTRARRAASCGSPA